MHLCNDAKRMNARFAAPRFNGKMIGAWQNGGYNYLVYISLVFIYKYALIYQVYILMHMPRRNGRDQGNNAS